MKIVYTGGFRFNESEAAEARVINNAKILRGLGHEVIFVCWGGSYLEEEKKSDVYYKDGFEYHISYDFIDNINRNIFQRLINFIFYGRESLKFVKSFNPDVVVGYNPTAYFTSKMLSLEKKRKFRFISDITEWFDPNEFPGGRLFPFAWINQFNMKILQKKVKSKIVISEFLEQYYKDSKNILLPPLIDINDAKWNNEGLDDHSLKYGKGKLKFIFAGYYGMKDLLLNIIQAVCKAYDEGIDLEIKIIGASTHEIENLIGKELFDKYKIIIFPLGKIKNNEVPKHYKNSDFTFIIRKPIRKNMAGFPTKFVEAMISGCPVIANNTSDLKNFLVHAENGYFVKDFSVDAIVETIYKIANCSESQIVLMKKNAHNTGKNNFHYKNYKEVVKNLFNK